MISTLCSDILLETVLHNFEYYPFVFVGAMTLNVWQNITIVKNNTNFSYYKNGASIATGVSSGTQTAIPFFVGGDNTGLEYSNSRIATVQIYNRALTAAEIQQNFTALSGRYGI